MELQRTVVGGGGDNQIFRFGCQRGTESDVGPTAATLNLINDDHGS